jgi:hypothetical protein
MQGTRNGRAGGVAAGGGAPHSRANYTPWGTPNVGRTGGTPLPYEVRSLGYPHRRKNGGHSEAGAQPCRFIARRATNGAPPSEATQPKRESRRRPSARFALLGYPRSRTNGGHDAGEPSAEKR